MKPGAPLPKRNQLATARAAWRTAQSKGTGLVLPSADYLSFWGRGSGLRQKLRDVFLFDALRKGRESSHWSLYNKFLRPKVSAGNDGYYPSENLNPNLDEAFEKIRLIASHSVLEQLQGLKVQVMGTSTEGPFRPHSVYGTIRVGYLEGVDLIMHEIGHFIEDWLGCELWWEVTALREARHGWTTMSPVAVAIPSVQEPDEEMQGRFAGSYPATAEYTSKIYEFGATEMTSMALQMLAHAETMDAIIANDPILILTVLRRLRPDDRQIQKLCEEYAQYLPYCPTGSIYDQY